MRLLGKNRSFGTSLRGLDLLNFFLADVQTGFGAFIAVYLTAEKWTELQIGAILSIGTVATIVSQIPAGLLVDAMRNKRAAVAAGILSIAGAALLFAAAPFPLPVAIAEVLHGFASCALTPAIAALSLKLVGHAALGDRLGRNARFASMGSAVAAAVMGGLGTYVAPRAVFLMTAAIAVPALWALARIAPEPEPGSVSAPMRAAVPPTDWAGVRALLSDRRLVAFAACVVMFHLANAAMLPIAASDVTASAGAYASLIIAVCIVVPQIVVAIASPWVGHHANLWGRRPLMLLGWAALPVRGLLFALLPAPWMIVGTQALDGVSAAVFGVMLPLVAADLTLRSGRFNLCIGIFGLATRCGCHVEHLPRWLDRRSRR